MQVIILPNIDLFTALQHRIHNSMCKDGIPQTCWCEPIYHPDKRAEVGFIVKERTVKHLTEREIDQIVELSKDWILEPELEEEENLDNPTREVIG